MARGDIKYLTLWGTDNTQEPMQVPAPADFNWSKFPETLIYAGKVYEYVGTQDSEPVYAEQPYQFDKD